MSEIETRVEIDPAKIRLFNNSRDIYQPYYVDEARVLIRAIVRGPDGRLTEVDATKEDPQSDLYRDIYAQYSETEIEMFTHREWLVSQKRRERDEKLREDDRIEDARETLAVAKAQALEIVAVRDCADREIPRLIRKAKNPIEVQAWTAIALTKSRELILTK